MLLDKLRSIVGPANLLAGVDLSPYVVDGRTPEAAVFPGSLDETRAVVELAASAGVPIVPWGGGTAAAVGAPPSRPGLVLGLGRLGRLVEHEPGDLTATVQAGMTVAALQSALRARGQWLSLDPPDPGRATIGGVLAANASGPRRHLYGTARDLLIGVTVVTGDGAVVRGGGKVVKNVAGYDLPKLFVGSHGTLGVIVEATLKLRPVADVERLVAVRFDRVKDAGAAARAVMGSDLVPTALDLLDGEAARAMAEAGERGRPPGALLAVGFDGLAEQVDWQCGELGRVTGPLGGSRVVTLPGAAWDALGSAAPRAVDPPAAVVRLVVMPAQVADVMEQAAGAARARGLVAAVSAHAGVGVLTAALGTQGAPEPATVAAVLQEWRAMARAGGGHATLESAPLAVKAQVPAWDDPGAAGRIMKAIKAQLDPRGILNPGRFVAGI